MRVFRKGWGLCVVGAALQAACPLGTFAADSTPPAPASVQSALAIRDVELDQSGTLRGQLLTPEGAALADCQITVSRFGKLAGETTTDKEGKFAVAGQKGGTFELRGGDAVAWVRLWTHDSAPPAATKAALLVTEKATVRGQINYMNSHMLLSNEALGAAMIPGAIGGGLIILKQHHEHDSGS